MKLPFRKALVLAPHTDDGEFGCGGTISRLLREGCEVYYVAFSDCRASVPAGFAPDILRTELMNATKVLGISAEDVQILDFEVRYFPRDRQAILESMVELRRSLQPDVVFCTCSTDFHQDHKTVSEEAVRAFKTINIYGYELPWNNLMLPSQALIRLETDDVEKKVSAIGEYRSQRGRGYSEPDFLRAQVRTRGARIGTRYAEAFEIIRQVL